MPGKIATALSNLELKRLQNEKKAKNARANTLKKQTNIKHPKGKTGGGKTRKGRKVRKTRKGRK
jgi:hypothetical protein